VQIGGPQQAWTRADPSVACLECAEMTTPSKGFRDYAETKRRDQRDRSDKPSRSDGRQG
jgi:hypothetical protein